MATATQTRLPPGPKGTWRPTLKLIRNPRQAIEGWVQRYGDPCFLTALNGPVVITGREDLIRVIYGQRPEIYSTFATQTIGSLLGSESIFVMEGDQHREERKLLTPMFHGDRMRAYGPLMQETALAQLERHRQKPVVSTLDLMTDISLEVIVRAIFGGDDPQRVAQMMEASTRVVAAAHPLLFFSVKTHVRFLGWSPYDRWVHAKENLASLLRQAMQDTQGNDDRQDILSLMCRARGEGQALPATQIESELMTLLFAGHETTALTLTWAIYHVHRQPRVLAKLREELDGLSDLEPENLNRAPYLKAVIQETLRVHPIVTETLRKLKLPLELDSFCIPAGTGLAIATILAHYQPEVWPDPETFQPERFLDRSYSPFVYMPFGGGHRRCLGAAFASYEMAMVLGTLLKNYEFQLVDDQIVVPKRRSVTMGPSSNVPVRVQNRS